MKKQNHCKSVTADRVSGQKYDRGSPVHAIAHRKYTAQKGGNTTGVVVNGSGQYLEGRVVYSFLMTKTHTKIKKLKFL